MVTRLTAGNDGKGVQYFSVLILVLANMVPLFGVLFLGWNVAEVMLLYWSESAIIGFFTVLKLIFAEGSLDNTPTAGTPIKLDMEKYAKYGKIFFIPFFIIHYSGFMLGHLVFIGILLQNSHLSIIGVIYTTALGFFFLFVSHGLSFVTNYLGKKEYERANISKLMTAPYYRIFVMHFTILFGAFLGIHILILVIGKTLIDLWSHLEERKRFSQAIQA